MHNVLKIIFNKSIDNFPKTPLTKLTSFAKKPSRLPKVTTTTQSVPKQFMTFHQCLKTNIYSKFKIRRKTTSTMSDKS
jgi:hypothetical protein